MVIPKRHVETVDALDITEWVDIHMAIRALKAARGGGDFTIGINDGVWAGRTIPHVHVHVIPRIEGDVSDPRGGVRQIFLRPEIDPWLRHARRLKNAGKQGH